MNYNITIQFNDQDDLVFRGVRGEVVGMFYTINFTNGSKQRIHVNTIRSIKEECVSTLDTKHNQEAAAKARSYLREF